MISSEIRKAFFDFFISKQHTVVESAPMVVKNDPTLMFTNAGMNQFKDIFLGNRVPESLRVADTQKCLRVSGKHNDLEEVGRDTYHHTMFEMLGNWSFGDYFKDEAIQWAWELLTVVYKMPVDRLYATIYAGSPDEGVDRDNEAYDMWKKYLPEDHIIEGGRKDNFWEMGDTGPCGPCSEIHYDLRKQDEREQIDGASLVNKNHPHVIEIWNLVFMQFNRKANGVLEPLPARHVDTGMGFERLCMILQGMQSNYDTDVFQPIIIELSAMCGKKYGEKENIDIAMRVIADHLRAIAFSIADGQLPSNAKAGYVIRRILRRAVRYGYTYLGFTEPFIYKLTDVLIENLGQQFPELTAQRKLIGDVICEEENSFLHTLSVGINLLDNVIKKAAHEKAGCVSGRDAFVLYDTYGFPFDLTELIAREHGLSVNIEEFEKELEAQKIRSRNAATVETGDWTELLPATGSVFTGYDTLESEVRITRYRMIQTKGKSFYQLVFDKTPFYGNSGGQVGDTGFIEKDGVRTEIKDTQKENNLTVHIAEKLPADLTSVFRAVVDANTRVAIANNHTATHLLHEALRTVLGAHVEQKGSLVAAGYLRFDFSHFQKVTDEQLEEVERIVNIHIRNNYVIDEKRDCPFEEAKDMGAMMLFGEKYGAMVRVVRFGSSVELCGGTHVKATGNIGLFKITAESAVAAGVRRIEAVTAAEAERFVFSLQRDLDEIRETVNSPSALQAVKKLREENDDLTRQIKELQREKVGYIVDAMTGEATKERGLVLMVKKTDMTTDMIKDIAFTIRQKMPEAALVIGSLSGGKPTLTVAFGDDAVGKGLNASAIVRIAAGEINGGGGGQPFYATAGGKNPGGLDRAIAAAAGMIKETVQTND